MLEICFESSETEIHYFLRLCVGKYVLMSIFVRFSLKLKSFVTCWRFVKNNNIVCIPDFFYINFLDLEKECYC